MVLFLNVGKDSFTSKNRGYVGVVVFHGLIICLTTTSNNLNPVRRKPFFTVSSRPLSLIIGLAHLSPSPPLSTQFSPPSSTRAAASPTTGTQLNPLTPLALDWTST